MTRWPSRAVLVGALLAGAPGWARGQEGPTGAPLQESKQALRELEKEKAQGERPAGSLRGALPQIAPPELGTSEPRYIPPSSDKQTNGRKTSNAGLDNWLLNGMRNLARESSKDSRERIGRDDDDQLDPTAPDYLMQSFIRDRETRGEAARRRSSNVDPDKSTQTDPFAPFLSDWLHDSSKGLGLLNSAGLPREGAGNRTSMRGGALAGEESSGRLLDSGVDPAGVRLSIPGTVTLTGDSGPSNPFLAGLGNVPTGSVPANSLLFAGTVSNSPPAVQPATRPTPQTAQPAAPPPVTSPDRKAPSSPLVENEKYFPQQRKF